MTVQHRSDRLPACRLSDSQSMRLPASPLSSHAGSVRLRLGTVAWAVAVGAAVLLPLLVFMPGFVSAQDSVLERIFRPVLPNLSSASPPPSEPPAAEPALPAELADILGGPAASNAAPPAAEELPPGPGERVLVPLSNVGTPGEVRYEEQGELLSLVVRDASLSYVLAMLAERRGLSIVASNDIDAIVSVTLFNRTIEDALTAILSVANYTWTFHDGIIYVTSLSEASMLPADLQGRRIQVFPLDYASGQALLEAVQSFLSPVGQVFVTASSPTNNRLTQEVLVVEDLPHVLDRVAAFVHQMDQPPRQVLIEAHILQVELKDGRNHGVNFEYLFNTIGNVSTVGTVGLVADAPSPAFFASINEGHLRALVNLLKTTSDAKTLASPRLLVINEQEARLQVGEQLGYRVTTTTETSTLESVNFLDVGVILQITPRITRDNHIMLKVRPEVSGGQVNAETGLPDSETSYLETNVLLEDGYGVVIGGLIKETDSVSQTKVPYLGDVYLIGKLFQREDVTKERSEIIVVLIPRVYPYSCDYAAYEEGNVVRTEVELFEGPLLKKDRPWQPKLPDAVTNPRVLRLPPVGQVYPYPAVMVEMAGTPQPQRQFPIPPRPGPAVRWAPGAPPQEGEYERGHIGYQEILPPGAAVSTDPSATSAPVAVEPPLPVAPLPTAPLPPAAR